MAVVADYYEEVPNLRKRKRRRRQDKPPINARLVLDDHVKGDVGILSEDLFNELFPGDARADDTNGNEPTTQALHHIAISPKGPATAIENLSWTIVPVRSSSALANNTIQFSPGSSSLQGFAEELQRVAPSRLLSHSRSGIEVCVLDVLPLALETVFVTLEGDLAKRLLNGEGTFHLEHRQNNGYNSKNKSAGPEDRLTAAVREALGALKVVHSGDFFALPLPPHPITHVPPPPAKVTLCEPVAQGLLAPSTRIIVTQSHHHSSKASRKPPLDRSLHEVAEEAEDTANEQFFSAAEDRYRTDAAVTEDDESQTETETELSAGDDNDDLSDDSMDDMISLQAPMLPITNPSGMSTAQIGSPMGLGMRHHTNGINTPGSIFSTMTSATARPGGQRGRLFKAQGLLQPLPEELLRPVPAKEDDEEARIYVDVSSLAKIGCFSGDWVRLETASEPPSAGLGLWGLGSFGQQQADEDFLWRPARIYSLPEGYGSSRPVAKLPSGRNGNGSHERKTSFFEAQVSRPTSPTVYLSPLLLANLENTPYLRLSPLKRATATKSFSRLAQPKSSSSGAQPLKPPVAREVELVKIASPLSTEALMQNSLFARLKWYFSRRKRVLKEGDLVGVMVDEVLGRTLGPGTGTGGDAGAAEDGLLITSSEPGGPDEQNTATGVVWFRIGHITPARTDDVDAAMEDSELWNGVATIDVAVTKMAQTGIAQSRIPGTADSSWEFYLGLRRTAPAAPSYSSAYSSGSLPTSLPLPVAPSEKPTNLRRRLRDLIAASTSPQARSLDLKPLAVLLTSTQRNIGKSWTVQRACADLGLHVFVIDAYDLLGDAAGESQKQEALLKARAERAMGCGSENCALLIRHAEALTSDRMVGAVESLLEATTAGGTGVRVLVATTTETDKVPEGVRKLFGYELEMGAPDEGEREAILRGIIAERGVSVAGAVDLSAVAVKTAALVAGDLVDVVDRALVSRRSRIETLAAQSSLGSSVTGTGSATGTPITTRDVTVAAGHEGRCLTKQDFDTAVEQARKTFADAIGAPKIPTVTWADVGGLSHIKSAVLETISLPLERPELFAAGLKKRSGILFYGPPGTGKTLLAKAIATEFSLNFFSVKGPELLNMYIGESEANVRRVFQRARDARPCVVFFDELDSVAPKRGNQGDSGGVMDRIVSQLLAELDGMSGGGGDEEGGGGAGGVFVIGATNRPDLLDQALLRPGRFDKMLYLGVSDTREKQVTIMEALTRKFTMAPTLSLSRVAATLPFTYTGADFYALCSDAMLKAVTRKARLADRALAALNSSRRAADPTALPVTTASWFDHYATPQDVAVCVEEEDFLLAQRELVPSVSAKELEHYARVREIFEAVEKDQSEASAADDVASVSSTDGTVAGASGSGANRSQPPQMAPLALSRGGSGNGNSHQLTDRDRRPGSADGSGNGSGHGNGNGHGNGTGIGNGNSAAMPLAHRPKPYGSGSGSGSGRPRSSRSNKDKLDKGKGKARAEDGDEDDAGVEADHSDAWGSRMRPSNSRKGSVVHNGVDGGAGGGGLGGFGRGRVEDDEDLY